MPIKLGQVEDNSVDLPMDPNAPPEKMPASLEAMPEEERKELKKKLQAMPKEEIEKLSKDEFKIKVTWIMDYMAWMYRASDHKILFSICNKDFPEWFEVFIERYGVPV